MNVLHDVGDRLRDHFEHPVERGHDRISMVRGVRVDAVMLEGRVSFAGRSFTVENAAQAIHDYVLGEDDIGMRVEGPVRDSIDSVAPIWRHGTERAIRRLADHISIHRRDHHFEVEDCAALAHVLKLLCDR